MVAPVWPTFTTTNYQAYTIRASTYMLIVLLVASHQPSVNMAQFDHQPSVNPRIIRLTCAGPE